MNEADEVLGLDGLRAWIPISRRTITDGIREGRDLPPHFRVGRKILFRKSLLLKWIEEHEEQGAKGHSDGAGGDTA